MPPISQPRRPRGISEKAQLQIAQMAMYARIAESFADILAIANAMVNRQEARNVAEAIKQLATELPPMLKEVAEYFQ